MNIVILAAGRGKRMHSNLPKVLHPLAGKPMIEHVIDKARALKPHKIIVVVGHQAEAVQEALGDKQPSPIPGESQDKVGTHLCTQLVFVHQHEQKGTGHAVLQAIPALGDEPFTLILLGDVPLVSLNTLEQLCHIAQQKGAAILTTELSNPHGYGRIQRELVPSLETVYSDKVIEIVEEADASPTQKTIKEINTGIMLVPTARLKAWLNEITPHNAQGEYYLTDIISLAYREGRPLFAVPTPDSHEVMGINDQVQLAQAERIWQQYQATEQMKQGVRLFDPDRIDIRGRLFCGQDVQIDINCIFMGEVVLGNHVSVGAHCILNNIEVKAGTRIEPYSHLEDASIGAHCRIGPYARIRPGTRLGNHVHIGNFVEVKNSQIEKGSKANHLSYVGDATVGENVNIGAGTITCNYDGVNKSRTIIEDGAFIGSDTILVAPVIVRRGAYIGAGSVITSEAPAEHLTVARARQKTIRPIKK